MNNNQFSVAIIGAGHAGLELLERLIDAEFINILGIADTNINAPGIKLAAKHDIHVTVDMLDLLQLGTDIDIIIDVTGVKAVRDKLRSTMQTSHNNHTIIMHERISALLLSLFNGKMVTSKASDELY